MKFAVWPSHGPSSFNRHPFIGPKEATMKIWFWMWSMKTVAHFRCHVSRGWGGASFGEKMANPPSSWKYEVLLKYSWRFSWLQLVKASFLLFTEWDFVSQGQNNWCFIIANPLIFLVKTGCVMNPSCLPGFRRCLTRCPSRRRYLRASRNPSQTGEWIRPLASLSRDMADVLWWWMMLGPVKLAGLSAGKVHHMSLCSCIFSTCPGFTLSMTKSSFIPPLRDILFASTSHYGPSSLFVLSEVRQVSTKRSPITYLRHRASIMYIRHDIIYIITAIIFLAVLFGGFLLRACSRLVASQCWLLSSGTGFESRVAVDKQKGAGLYCSLTGTLSIAPFVRQNLHRPVKASVTDDDSGGKKGRCWQKASFILGSALKIRYSLLFLDVLDAPPFEKRLGL